MTRFHRPLVSMLRSGLSRSSVLGIISGNNFLLYDEFFPDLAAGSVNGTRAIPGGSLGTVAQNTRVVVDTPGTWALTSGELLAGNAPAANDPRLNYSPFTRVAGLTASFKVFWTIKRGGFGWSSSATPGGGAVSIGVSCPSGQLTVMPPSSVGFIQFQDFFYYRVQVTLFGTGGAIWAQDGGGAFTYANPTLLAVDEFTSTNWPFLTFNSSTATNNFKMDWVKVYIGSFRTLQDIASVFITNPANGVNYTTQANAHHYLVFTQPAVPVGGDKIELRYRYQDATNYWTAYITYNGGTLQWDFHLDEVLAGVTTPKTTVPNVGSSITGLYVASYGNSHTPFTRIGGGSAYTIRGSTITDADLNASTEVGAWFNAGTITRLSSYPRTFSGSIT